jgi:hypothetical protein
MAKKAKSKKSVSKTTRRKPAPTVVEAAAEPDWDALERERREDASRRAALIAAKDAQVSAMIAGCGRSAVRTELSPLHDALAMACIWSNALAQSMVRRRELPKSVALGRWTEQWATEYGNWWDAIKAARALAMSPAVAAIMDAGEERPTKKWTSRTVAELDRLAATLHPSREGGSGLAFIRAGAESLPANFSALVDAIAARVVELQSVPQSESAAPERDDGADSQPEDKALPPALGQSDCIVLHSLKQLGQERLHSAEQVAAWLKKNRLAMIRTARTINTSIRNLVKLGYAERPSGPRSGARLTIKGLRAKDTCA